jgi:hypothetical protein
MLIPPLFLVTDSVKGIVMDGAKRHYKLITDLVQKHALNCSTDGAGG